MPDTTYQTARSLSLGEASIQPVRHVTIDDASVVPHPSQLKNDDAVVIIKDANGEKNVDDLGWQSWRLNNPDGLQGFAKLNSGAQRIK